MLLASAPVWAALLSGVIHILVLGWMTTVSVSTLAPREKLLKVALIQPARPLPMGEPQGKRGEATAPPAKKRARPVRSLQQPQVRKTQPKPKSKTTLKPPQPAQPVAEKPRPVVAALPREKMEADPRAEDAGSGSVVDRGLTDPNAIASSGLEGSVLGDGMQAGGGQGSGRGDGATVAQPHYDVNPKPRYPRIARRLGAQGVVTLRVFVLKDGSVGQAAVLRSSGFRMLDNSALRTVRSAWRFLPALHKGLAVDSWVEIPIKFVLEVS